MKLSVVVLSVLILGLIARHTETFVLKFTKISCKCTDKSFCSIEICRLKAVSRNLQYFQLHVKYLELPVNDTTTRFHVTKRANGYKPFLYDITVKCDFTKHLTPLTRILWSWIKDSTNLNYTCPFVEDLTMPRIENIYVQKKLSNLPIPDGDYGLCVLMKANNRTAMELGFYVSIV